MFAPYGRGVLQDQMLAGSRLGTLCARAGGGMGALGMDVSGMDEMPSIFSTHSNQRSHQNEVHLEEGLLPWLVLHLLSPGALSGHQLLEDVTAPNGSN